MPAVTIEFSTMIVIMFGIINLIVIGPVAWILKGVVADLRGLQKDHEALKDELHVDYVRRSEHDDDMKEIKGLLRDIYDKMSAKADKQ